MSLKFHNSGLLPFWTVKCERLADFGTQLYEQDSVSGHQDQRLDNSV